MYITNKLLAVKSSTTTPLLAVWGVLVITTTYLLAGYYVFVSCQLTISQLSLFKVANQKRTYASSMPGVGFSGLQGGLVDIIIILRHKAIVNKQVTAMGYYFWGRGKKCKFRPKMASKTAMFAHSGGNIRRSWAVLSHCEKRHNVAFEVNHGK